MSQPNPSHSRSSSVASVLTATRGFLRTQLWVWPLVAALVLAFLGVWLRVKMEGATKQQIANTLQTILNANTEALRSWSVTMKSEAEDIADDDRVRELAAGLIQQTKSSPQVQATLLTSPQLAALRIHLKPVLDRRGFSGFVVLDTNFMVLASMRDQLVGHAKTARQRGSRWHHAWPAKSWSPSLSPAWHMLPDQQGNLRVGVPTMFAAAPIRSTDGQIIAILGLRIAPDKDFTRILATARAGQSGETYAFGRDGKQLSESRFDNDLKRLGLIPDTGCSALDPDPGVARSAGGPQPGTPVAQAPYRTAVHPCGERGVGGPRGRGCRWLPRLPRRAGGGRVDVAGRFRHGPGHGTWTGPRRSVRCTSCDWVSGSSSACCWSAQCWFTC